MSVSTSVRERATGGPTRGCGVRVVAQSLSSHGCAPRQAVDRLNTSIVRHECGGFSVCERVLAPSILFYLRRARCLMGRVLQWAVRCSAPCYGNAITAGEVAGRVWGIGSGIGLGFSPSFDCADSASASASTSTSCTLRLSLNRGRSITITCRAVPRFRTEFEGGSDETRLNTDILLPYYPFRGIRGSRRAVEGSICYFGC